MRNTNVPRRAIRSVPVCATRILYPSKIAEHESENGKDIDVRCRFRKWYWPVNSEIKVISPTSSRD